MVSGAVFCPRVVCLRPLGRVGTRPGGPTLRNRNKRHHALAYRKVGEAGAYARKASRGALGDVSRSGCECNDHRGSLHLAHSHQRLGAIGPDSCGGRRTIPRANPCGGIDRRALIASAAQSAKLHALYEGKLMTVLGPKLSSAMGVMLPHEHVMSTFGLDAADNAAYGHAQWVARPPC
jgi:hypothetical protein